MGPRPDRHPLTFLDQHVQSGTAPEDRPGPGVAPIGDRPPLKGGGPRDAPASDLEATWVELERIGRLTGHVVTQCSGCGGKAMTAIVTTTGTSRWVKSGGGWPRCKQCCPGVDLKSKPRVEPIGDVTLVARVRPGHMATARELARYRRRLAQEDPPPEGKLR